MAYDNEGNYYFEPAIDADDMESLNQFDRLGAAAQYRKTQAQNQVAQNFVQDTWRKSLEEEGISHAEYGKLFRQDPQAGHQAIQAGMRLAAKTMKQRRPAGQPGQPPAAGPAGGRQIPVDEARSMAAAKEKTRKGGQLSDNEIIDIMPDLF